MEDKVFDYIIVGAGVGGIVVASRLHEYLPKASILIIEAGPEFPNSISGMKRTDTIMGRPSQFAESLHTVPQKHLGMLEMRIDQPRAFGGGGFINGKGWARACRGDQDTWAKVVGDSAWSFDALTKYVKMSEQCVPPGDPLIHGNDGKMPIDMPPPPIPSDRDDSVVDLTVALRNRYKELGVHPNWDFNSGDGLGCGGMPSVMDDEDRHERTLPQHKYQLEGVKVVSESPVARVMVSQDSTKVTGIECWNGHQYWASQEIVLSAGTINTPKIMLHSGIGDPSDLESIGIPVRVKNPEVGKNFCDHFDIRQLYKLRNPEKKHKGGMVTFEQASTALVEAALHTDGSSNPASHDVLYEGRAHTETFIQYIPNFALVNQRMSQYYETDASDGRCVLTRVILTSPTSRGSIAISSKDPRKVPLIDPNYYATETDRAILRDGIRRLANVLCPTNSSAESPFIEELVPNSFSHITPSTSDAVIDDRIAKISEVMWHPMGSCAMGKVIDSHLRVFGLHNMRIVDASVFPIPIGTHPQATVYAVGEKAAAMIAEDSKKQT